MQDLAVEIVVFPGQTRNRLAKGEDLVLSVDNVPHRTVVGGDNIRTSLCGNRRLRMESFTKSSTLLSFPLRVAVSPAQSACAKCFTDTNRSK
jgi:hypothetical protein